MEVDLRLKIVLESTRLLTYASTNFDLVEISNSNEAFSSVEVWLGKQDTVKVYTKKIFLKLLKRVKRKNLKSKSYNRPIEAPIKKDQVLQN